MKLRKTVFFSGNDSIVLYAHWTINNYTIDFETDGGTYIPSTEVEYDSLLDIPTDITKDGYAFYGWFLDPDFKTKMDLVKMPARNLTLHAKWVRLYKILLYTTDGIVDVDCIYRTYGSDYGTLPVARREGYTFDGWFTKENDGDRILETSKFYGTADTVIYAHWTINKYGLVFNSNGGTDVPSKSLEYGSVLDIPTDVKKNGFVFGGWFLDPNFVNQMNLTRMPAKDITLYAKWDCLFKITFDAMGGTTNTSYILLTTGMVFGHYGALPVPSKEGYVFNGWFTEENGGELIIESTEFSGSENSVLYAHWTAKKFTIDYVTNGGATVPSTEIEYGSILNIPTNLEREGFAFAGWYLDSDFNYKMNLTTMPAKNIILYAKWNKFYKISFNAEGGTLEDTTPLSLLTGMKFGTLPTPTKEGHTFAGWFTGQEGGERVNDNTVFSGTSDTVLHAHWIVNKYDIAFESNGGTIVSSIKVEYGAAISLPTNLEKKGFIFGGWYLDAEFKEVMNLKTMPARNLVLYAKWNEEKQVDSAVIIASVVCGSIVILGLAYVAMACFCSACAYHALFGKLNLFNQCECGQALMRKMMHDPENMYADAELNNFYNDSPQPTAPPTYDDTM